MFAKAMEVMTCFYASPLTTVIQHTRQPCRPLAGWDGRPYQQSGWCNMEQASALLMSEGGVKLFEIDAAGVRPRRLDLSSRQWFTPEKMDTFFHDEERCMFYGRGDRDAVSAMYRDFYQNMIMFDRRQRRPLSRIAEGCVTRLTACYGSHFMMAYVVITFFVVLPIAGVRFVAPGWSYALENNQLHIVLWLLVLQLIPIVLLILFPFCSPTFRHMLNYYWCLLRMHISRCWALPLRDEGALAGGQAPSHTQVENPASERQQFSTIV